jgi:hypothetical protein
LYNPSLLGQQRLFALWLFFSRILGPADLLLFLIRRQAAASVQLFHYEEVLEAPQVKVEPQRPIVPNAGV